MASLEKRGKAWRVRWVDPSGHHRSKQFTRKADADAWRIKVSHELLSGGYVTPSKMTVQQWGEEWRAGKLHAASSRAAVEQRLRKHLYPALGSMPLAKVRPSHVQALVNDLAQRLAPITVRAVYAHTSSMFADAVRDQLLAANPCNGIDLPKIATHRLQLLTVEDVWAIIDGIDPAFRATVVLGAGAGLRPGEALGLEVHHVDFLRHSIRVEQQLWTPPRGRPVVQAPKTVESRRVVPVPDFVTNEISAHLARRGVRSGFVTELATRHRYTKAWRRSPAPEWAVPHDLRHFYASLLISEGADVKVVQRRLGHTSAATTLNVYTHLWHDNEDATRDAVGRVLAPPLPARPETRRSPRG